MESLRSRLFQMVKREDEKALEQKKAEEQQKKQKEEKHKQTSTYIKRYRSDILAKQALRVCRLPKAMPQKSNDFRNYF